ncbi:hypothetical protein FHR56_003722 [Xanthomonas sacchari]|uniref:hypothetical protein n=1 Tax=Xanthomonas sp. F10 TaxID=3035309 RepID=UPI00181AA73A|nr:hypothetical protein [Xanthomonas sp. F10]MBB6368543.1 hypothetical protein [Xanthomonas sp. F10]
MPALREFEIKAIGLLTYGVLEPAQFHAICSATELSDYSQTEGGYSVSVAHASLPTAAQTLRSPSVLGRAGDTKCGFICVLADGQLTLEYHSVPGADVPENIRELPVQIALDPSSTHIPRLTTLDDDGWMIGDGEVAHAEHPDTYWVPPLVQRASLEIGVLVKVCFYIRVCSASGELKDRGERMWVQVQARQNGWYFGVLDNDPYCTEEIRAGLPIWFQPRHVIDIYQS